MVPVSGLLASDQYRPESVFPDLQVGTVSPTNDATPQHITNRPHTNPKTKEKKEKKTLTNLLKTGNQTCKIVKMLNRVAAVKMTLNALASSLGSSGVVSSPGFSPVVVVVVVVVVIVSALNA